MYYTEWAMDALIKGLRRLPTGLAIGVHKRTEEGMSDDSEKTVLHFNFAGGSDYATAAGCEPVQCDDDYSLQQ